MLDRLNKDVDLSWGEIAEITGMKVSDGHIRKMAYGVRLYDDYIREKHGFESDSEIELKDELNRIDEKTLELKRKRQQLSDERTYTNKKIRALSRIEDFMNLLRDELTLVADEKPLIVEKKKDMKEISDDTGILLLSDIHYGIDSDSSLNVYNPDVAKTRMNYLVDKVIENCNRHNIKELYVVDLGDTISGHIHNNLRLENRMGVAHQIVGVAELISTALHKLAQNIPSVQFGMVEGNHDRILPAKDDNLNKDSFSVLVNNLIKERTKDIKNLTFYENNCDTYLQLKIHGKVCTFVHGDKDKPKSAVSGINAITGSISDYIFMGHFHSANEFTENQSEVIVNGTFAGVDEYAINIRKNSPPVQKFIVMNDAGRECTYNINVGCKA